MAMSKNWYSASRTAFCCGVRRARAPLMLDAFATERKPYALIRPAGSNAC